MRAPAMIITEIARQDSFQMTLTQHDDMIQAISSDVANYSLDRCILPRASRSSITSSMPKLRTRLWNSLPQIASRFRNRYFGAASQGNASMIRWAVHWAVGCSVTLKCTATLSCGARATTREYGLRSRSVGALSFFDTQQADVAVPQSRAAGRAVTGST
jgi:hypothetical protein